MFDSAGWQTLRIWDALGVNYAPKCGACRRADRSKNILFYPSSHICCSSSLRGGKPHGKEKNCVLTILAVHVLTRLSVNKGWPVAWD